MHLTHWAKLNLKCLKVFFERIICNFLFQMMAVPSIFSIQNGFHKTLKVIIETFKVWRPWRVSRITSPSPYLLLRKLSLRKDNWTSTIFIAPILINIYIEMYCWITAVLHCQLIKIAKLYQLGTFKVCIHFRDTLYIKVLLFPILDNSL